MRKIGFLVLLVLGMSAVSMASNNSKGDDYTSELNVSVTKTLQLPYSSNIFVNMEKVYQKDNYSLWRCQSSNIDKFPGKGITGKSYNYFVYKSGKFHLTVNESNKTNVYEFFSK
jgi:hypothetical protein